MVKLNLNTVLLILGGLGVFAPDIKIIAQELASFHIIWLAPIVKVLGFTATVFGSLALAAPKLRAFLAIFKLATPAGAIVPHLQNKSQDTTAKKSESVAPIAPKGAGFRLSSRITVFLAFSLVAILLTLVFLRKAKAGEISSAPTPVPVAVPVPATTPSSATTPPSSTRKPYVDSKYGGCRGNLCLAPALAIQAFQYVPATGDMTGGVTFSGGYGVVWHTIVDLGFAGYGGIQYSRDKPFTAQLVGMFNVANYVAFGPGFQILGQPTGPAKFQLVLCFAANWIPGLVPAN